MGPGVREAIGNQRYARIACDGVGFLGTISNASEHANSSERLTAPEFLCDRSRVIFQKQILRKISNRNPTGGLVVDRQMLNRRTAQQDCEGLQIRTRWQLPEWCSQIDLRFVGPIELRPRLARQAADFV